jgi:uncharacterized protein DUF2190
MADYTPVYANGVKPFTATTSAAVTGGRVLLVSGDGTVAHASAGTDATCVGVAAHDAASGARVTVWPLNGVVHELAAPSAITAGAGVVSAVNGQVATATIATAAAAGTLLGVAATTAASNKVRVIGRQ